MPLRAAVLTISRWSRRIAQGQCGRTRRGRPRVAPVTSPENGGRTPAACSPLVMAGNAQGTLRSVAVGTRLPLGPVGACPDIAKFVFRLCGRGFGRRGGRGATGCQGRSGGGNACRRITPRRPSAPMPSANAGDCRHSLGQPSSCGTGRRHAVGPSQTPREGWGGGGPPSWRPIAHRGGTP